MGADELPGNANIYAAKSDQELTALAAQWESLDAEQRRALLTEVKMRMARQRGPDGTIRITFQRRYGRIIRNPDGSVVRIETNVVRVRPGAEGNQTFGVGFEQRASGSQPDEQSPPVITVKDPSP
ncbi:MAG: hypothetical protein GWM88_16095 [Pseudomonadales bacterium]|nr:hypothetical protein [Pseudomonadales bacterium]NIX09456.1 hypothetical protein [Pseudomonadales bacterium]